MVERFNAELLRYSKEPKPKKKTFVVLDDNELGFELDWDSDTITFFIYKGKKKNQLLKGESISIYSGEVLIRENLYSLISKYYALRDRDPELTMYTKIELNIIVSHLNYHAFAGTLKKVLTKEVIYN